MPVESLEWVKEVAMSAAGPHAEGTTQNRTWSKRLVVGCVIGASLLALAGATASAVMNPIVVTGFTGSGICVADGTYYFNNTINGKFVFRKGDHVIIWRGGFWEIFWDGPSSDVRIAINYTDCGWLPPATGWSVVGGCGGAITLSGQTCEPVPPEIVSIVRQNPTDEFTDATTVTFRVRFTEEMRGVHPDGSDFTTSGAATGTVSSVATVTSDTVFDVTVTGITGTGELDLDMAVGNDMTDNNGNALGVTPIIGYEETYTIDAGRPEVVSVTVSDTLIADADTPGLFYVTVVFDETMTCNGSADPTLVFDPALPGTLSFGTASWADVDTYTVIYELFDAGVDHDSVTIDVTGAKDVAGNDQQDYTPVHEFEIDTENPTVAIVIADPLINDADAGSPWYVYINASEPTPQQPAPGGISLAFSECVIDPAYGCSGSLLLGPQSWLNSITYRVRYDVQDVNETRLVDASVTEVRDLAGNLMEPHPTYSYGAFLIDTENPAVTSVSVSNTLISDADAGGIFTVTVDFDEAMTTDGSADPTVTFSPAVGSTLSATGGNWPDSDTYQATYDISDASVDEDSVTIDVTGAKDANGNDQQDYTPEDEFGIDTLNPTVTILYDWDDNHLITDDDIGDAHAQGFYVHFSEPMTRDGTADPVFSFAPNVDSTLPPATGHTIWASNNTFGWYTLEVDANVDVEAVTVDVDGARDEHGNLMAPYTPEVEFGIDTRNPSVDYSSFSTLFIGYLKIGTPFTTTVRYDESMDPTDDPVIVYSEDIVGPGKTLQGGVGAWSTTTVANDTFKMTYTVGDEDLEIDGVSATVSGGRDAVGNDFMGSCAIDPFGGTHPDPYEFSVDTLGPSVLSVTPSAPVVSDGEAGGTFTLTVEFDDDMETREFQEPILTLAPDVSSTLTFVDGYWVDTDTFVAEYAVADAGVDVDSVTVDVTGAEDSPRNPQLDYTPVHTFEIDTLNPTVVSVEFSNVPHSELVTDENVDDGNLAAAYARFSEAMLADGSADPAFTFLPDVDSTLPAATAFTSWITGDTVFGWRTAEVDAEVDVDSVMIDVDGARDVHGNLMAPYTPEVEFGIDTLNPTVPTGLLPPDGSYTTDTTPTISWDAASDLGGGIDRYHRWTSYVGHVTTQGHTAGLSYTCTAYDSSYILEWRVRSQDLAGNYSDWATSTLYVDNDPPSFVGCPGDIAVTALPGAMMASVSWTEPTATDTIPGPILVGASHAPGDAFPIGTTTVTYTATDTAGHTAICSFDVTVEASCHLVTPIGACGFLDRGFPEGVEPPLVGELAVSAEYEVGELITGGCSVCTVTGDPITVPILFAFYRVEEVTDDYDVRTPLDAHFLYYDAAAGGYRFTVETAGLSPDHNYDIRLGFPDNQVIWLRVRLVPAAT